jgi:hypothetical protein
MAMQSLKTGNFGSDGKNLSHAIALQNAGK